MSSGLPILRDYLIRGYDDHLDYVPYSRAGELDPVELRAFVQEEGIGCKYIESTDVCVPTDEAVGRWVAKFNTASAPGPAVVTAADFRELVNRGTLLSRKVDEVAVPNPSQSAGESAATPKDAVTRPAEKSFIPSPSPLPWPPQGRPQGERARKRVTDEQYGTIYVGDENVPIDHDADVKKMASKDLPQQRNFLIPRQKTRYQFFVPYSAEEQMIFRLNFRDVDYHEGAPEPLVHPTHAWIAPRDFRGMLPDSGDASSVSAGDIDAWLHFIANDPYPSIPKARQPKGAEEARKYFARIPAAAAGTSSARVSMPPAEYQLRLVCGQAAPEAKVKDFFDNMALDVGGRNISFDPILGADLAKTVMLGDAYNRVIKRRKDGSRYPVPLEKTDNESNDWGKHLYPEAYLQFHPWTRNPSAMPYSDTRTFQVKAGRKYIFSMKIRGIDAGGAILIEDGRRFPISYRFRLEPHRNELYNVSDAMVDEDRRRTEEKNRELAELESLYSIDRKVKGWKQAQAAGYLPLYFHATDAYEDDEGLLIEVYGEPGQDKATGKLVREECGEKNYLSYWAREGDVATYKFKGRVALDSKFDADAILLQYMRTSLTMIDFMARKDITDYYEERGLNREYQRRRKEILERYGASDDASVQHPYKSVPASQQDLSVEFAAHSDDVKVSFISEHENFLNMTPEKMREAWNSSPYFIDELRFDDIELTDVETGEKILAWR